MSNPPSCPHCGAGDPWGHRNENDGICRQYRCGTGVGQRVTNIFLGQSNKCRDAELTQLRDRLERADNGEKWISEMLVQILATAASGFADAAVIADGPFDARHTLAVVEALASHAKDYRDRLGKAVEGLKRISLTSDFLNPTGKLAYQTCKEIARETLTQITK